MSWTRYGAASFAPRAPPYRGPECVRRARPPETPTARDLRIDYLTGIRWHGRRKVLLLKGLLVFV